MNGGIMAYSFNFSDLSNWSSLLNDAIQLNKAI